MHRTAAWALLVTVWSCATGPTPTRGLGFLVFDGHELHPSLVTRSLDDPGLGMPAPVRTNPELSTDAGFLAALAHSATQGRSPTEGGIDVGGLRSALYARYLGERGIGIYGFEARSLADADRIERALHDTWSYAARTDQARVHREGEVLVVVWADVGSPACWQAVNAAVAARLVAH